MIFAEHFIGFDPTRGAEQFNFCPRFNAGAMMVWYQKWIDTGWTSGDKINTGIVYTHCYATFDITGNLLSDQSICGPPCGGVAANTTGSARKPPPKPEEWLAYCREKLKHLPLKQPGTVELCDRIAAYIGR